MFLTHTKVTKGRGRVTVASLGKEAVNLRPQMKIVKITYGREEKCLDEVRPAAQ